MADETAAEKVKPMPDEHIAQLVAMVTAAEVLASVMHVTVPKAVEFMLRSAQGWQALTYGPDGPASLLEAVKLAAGKKAH